VDVQQVGESAFSEQLRTDDPYWTQCRERWGQGSGYKYSIKGWTQDWFNAREPRRQFIEDEIQRRWGSMIERLKSHILGIAHESENELQHAVSGESD
jgi:hypothetical protein